MTRYERERAKRQVVLGGRTFLRQPTPVQAAREVDAAMKDCVDSLRAVVLEAIRKINEAARNVK